MECRFRDPMSGGYITIDLDWTIQAAPVVVERYCCRFFKTRTGLSAAEFRRAAAMADSGNRRGYSDPPVRTVPARAPA